MAASEDTTALIERLDLLKSQISAGDANAKKEALQLSRILTVMLNEPANTAVELAFSVRTSQTFNLTLSDKPLGKAISCNECQNRSGYEVI